jgi:hypothetical protein
MLCRTLAASLSLCAASLHAVGLAPSQDPAVRASVLTCHLIVFSGSQGVEYKVHGRNEHEASFPATKQQQLLATAVAGAYGKQTEVQKAATPPYHGRKVRTINKRHHRELSSPERAYKVLVVVC